MQLSEFSVAALADKLVECGRTLEHYEQPQMRPLSRQDFRTYDSARQLITAIKDELQRRLR